MRNQTGTQKDRFDSDRKLWHNLFNSCASSFTGVVTRNDIKRKTIQRSKVLNPLYSINHNWSALFSLSFVKLNLLQCLRLLFSFYNTVCMGKAKGRAQFYYYFILGNRSSFTGDKKRIKENKNYFWHSQEYCREQGRVPSLPLSYSTIDKTSGKSNF